MRIPIPIYAKLEARRALTARRNSPVSNRAGLDKQQAKRLGIVSGVERAKQLANNRYVSIEDAKSIVRFHNRFKNKTGQRGRMAIGLWGGKRFGSTLRSKLKRI